MQRIDENTYIDDSLVTCAEYQLFIDEMREKGKYYQPDHWISYQFTEGQAREPILGVRYSDAEAFCNWLLDKEDIGGHFRLPMSGEVLKHPINLPNHIGKAALGYWISGIDNIPEFAWVDNASDNPRQLEILSPRSDTYVPIGFLGYSEIAKSKKTGGSIALDFDRDFSLDVNNVLGDFFDSIRSRAVNSDRMDLLNRADEIAYSQTLDYGLQILHPSKKDPSAKNISTSDLAVSIAKNYVDLDLDIC